jgi:PAS domain S-box-containing protein
VLELLPAAFAAAHEASPVGTALLSPDLGFVYSNPALQAILGRSAAELAQATLPGLLADDAARLTLPLAAGRWEGEIARPDGSAVWVELAVAPIAAIDGPPLYTLHANDLTSQRAAADALRAGERAARDASQLKSQFLANMSHEIRTPMNGVLGMIDALSYSPLNAEQRSYAELARRSADSLLTIIDDVLDFSKVEAGRLEIEATTIDLLQLLEDARDLLWHRAREQGLVLVSHVAPEVPTHVVGDPVRLRQVLINLLTNAIKFSTQGAVVFGVTTDGGDHLRFTVADQGIGMDAATVDKVFQPFVQADASTTRQFGGTGLGLAISRQLVELMGGTIGAASEVGVGSTFWFTARLPMAPDAVAEQRVLEGRRVLICSEEAVARDALEGLVARWGAVVTTTTPGDALRVLLKTHAAGTGPAVMLLSDPGGAAVADGLITRLREGTGCALPVVRMDRTGIAAEPLDEVTEVFPPFQRSVIRRALSEAAGQPTFPEAVAPRPATPIRPEEGFGQGYRVLVAEDNEVNQQVALLTLRRHGFTVDLARDGLEAVTAVEAASYDLILMDCQMPHMDGFAATGEIRRHQTCAAGTPIIAMTASSTTDDRARCLAAGMDDFVAKPVRARDLDIVLRRWLGRSGGLDEQRLAG